MNKQMPLLTEAGGSVRLDDLSRTRLSSGSLAAMIGEDASGPSERAGIANARLVHAACAEQFAPVIGTAVAATGVRRQLAGAGVDFDDVFAVLGAEGIDRFLAWWTELVSTVDKALAG